MLTLKSPSKTVMSFLLLLMAAGAMAQHEYFPLVEEGRHWDYEDTSGRPFSYVIRGDTAIGGRDYKKVYLVRDGGNDEQYFASIREADRRVYAMKDSQAEETMLYDFALSLKNDEIKYDEHLIYRVLSTGGKRCADGLLRRVTWFYVTNLDSQYQFTAAYFWVEGVGAPFYSLFCPTGFKTGDTPSVFKGCYQGDSCIFGEDDLYTSEEIYGWPLPCKPLLRQDRRWNCRYTAADAAQPVEATQWLEGDTTVAGNRYLKLHERRGDEATFVRGLLREDTCCVYWYDQQANIERLLIKQGMEKDEYGDICTPTAARQSCRMVLARNIASADHTYRRQGFETADGDTFLWLEGIGFMDCGLGFGPDHGHYELTSVYDGEECIYRNETAVPPVPDLAERTLPVEPDFGPGQLDVSQFEPTPVDFALGDCYVIYNVGAQAYFSEGNLWGAQASVSATTPLLVRFTLPEGRTLDDAALLFNDYSNLKDKWKLVFFDGNAEVYVDRGSQPDIYWQVVAGSGEKAYRLQASPLNPTYTPAAYGGFLGLDVAGDAGNTALSPFLTEGEGHHIDWQFFAVPEWTDYFKAKAVYDMAMKLKELIATAEAAGVSVAAAVAVYNDMSATVEQLQAAFDALTAAMVNNIGNGTPDKPGNATVVIANPNFDDASAAGWSGTTPNMVGSGAHGPANVAEHYNTTFDTYQDLSGLPAGVYALRAKTAFRGSWNDYLKGTPATARLYATVGDEDSEVPFNNIWSCLNTEPMAGTTEFGTTAYETTALNGVAYYSPNDPSAFRLYAERGFYDTTLFFEVTGDKARIGVRNPQKCGDGCDNWAIFDTFTLTYYGNEPGSYQKWLELAVPAVVLTEDDVYSTAYWDAYLEALYREVTGKAETLEAINLLKVRMAELQANIQAWKSYIEIVTVLSDRVEEYLDYPDLWLMEGARAARDYVETTYPQYLSARELTTAQLEEEYAKVETLLSDFMRDIHGFVTTAVDGLEKKHDGNGIRYTIDGRRARSEQRGIYIRDGRKVLK